MSQDTPGGHFPVSKYVIGIVTGSWSIPHVGSLDLEDQVEDSKITPCFLLPANIVNQSAPGRQEGIVEISTTIRDLKDAGVWP